MTINSTNDFMQGDCLQYMKTFITNAFDLGLIDPPYFDGPQKLGYYGSNVSTIGIKRKGYEKVHWKLPTLQHYIEIKRVCKWYIIWGANYFDFIGKPFKTPRGNEINEFIKNNPTNWIIWRKYNNSSSFNDYELAYTNIPIDTIFFNYMWNGMMQGKSIKEGHIQQGNKGKNEKRIHPTQKPVNLYLWLLMNFAKKGYKIFDPYLGSASSAIACHKLNYEFKGVEICGVTLADAKQRFDNATKQLQLFI
jgi:site-specific DNA-methyltransferase (adenine-specific)